MGGRGTLTPACPTATLALVKMVTQPRRQSPCRPRCTGCFPSGLLSPHSTAHTLGDSAAVPGPLRPQPPPLSGARPRGALSECLSPPCRWAVLRWGHSRLNTTLLSLKSFHCWYHLESLCSTTPSASLGKTREASERSAGAAPTGKGTRQCDDPGLTSRPPAFSFPLPIPPHLHSLREPGNPREKETPQADSGQSPVWSSETDSTAGG